MKVKDKHFYGFYVHSAAVYDYTVLEKPKLCIHNVTIIIVEGSSVRDTQNIRTVLITSPLQNYETMLNRFIENFSMVTDGTAVMARVENASVSARMHYSDKTWMTSTAHILKIAMKYFSSRYLPFLLP